ncbi:hypothetical protein [Desulfosporosinus shakirovi]|uniref:hypothetical protein n=1 Tax=Desulfosporosinus shakirovi TaxID=2885154 RepID=UPI001E4EE6D5|nr:hypothetical protein [Desulfosporosinus sp. SRJS8]MCB8813957.1 hypothetical protein [Desulfosporosinus sp. SRJS8]
MLRCHALAGRVAQLSVIDAEQTNRSLCTAPYLGSLERKFAAYVKKSRLCDTASLVLGREGRC